MNIMEKALRKAADTAKPNNQLSSLLTSVAERLDKQREEAATQAEEAAKQRRQRTLARQRDRKLESWVKVHDFTLMATRKRGLGSLNPASLKSWKPGKAVLIGNIQAVVKWGLSDGVQDCVVVEYEVPQQLATLPEKRTSWGLFPTSALSPCNCKGYVHRRCRKKQRTKMGV